MEGDLIEKESLENISNGIFIICPRCKGKGYCEETELDKDLLPELESSEFTLPVIGSPKAASSPMMSKYSLKEKFDYRLPNLLPEVQPKPRAKVNSHLRPPPSRGKNSDTSETMVDLIGHQDIEHPLEFTRVMKAQLVATDWNDRITGIQGAVHLSRIEPELVIHEGRTISRTILGELGSLRSRCVRVACQAAKELYKLSGFVFRPEYDEIVNSLLSRAADNKRIIRDEADEALAIISAYTPIQHIARAVTKNSSHKHQLVRKSALRIYKILISRIGTVQLMKNPNYQEIRKKIIEAGCLFLDDPISEIR
ncbi:uncharacterized protein [Halyomorpha halys]|nr:uncharacterized protein LOC106683087 isoform X2 [Halyomorpha halys]